MSCPRHLARSDLVECGRCRTPHCEDCLVAFPDLRLCASCRTVRLSELRSGPPRDPTVASLDARGTAHIADIVCAVVFFMLLPRAVVEPVGPAWMLILLVVMDAACIRAGVPTPGRLLLRLRVERMSGERPHVGVALVRAVSRGLLGTSLLVSFVVARFRPDRRTLHDLVAGTRVVASELGH